MSTRLWPQLSCLALAALLALAPSARAEAAIQPADPQPNAEDLEPGLAVRYHYLLVRHIDSLVSYISDRDGKAGPPLAQLNYRTGTGKVLTSKQIDGVLAKITGFIHLDTVGTYSMVVRSNDGVRLEIGGTLVIEDPDVHADRYSKIAKLEVTEPGWYPIQVLYFERKNTSTLQLYWKPPGKEAGSMAFVPAEAFAHTAGN